MKISYSRLPSGSATVKSGHQTGEVMVKWPKNLHILLQTGRYKAHQRQNSQSAHHYFNFTSCILHRNRMFSPLSTLPFHFTNNILQQQFPTFCFTMSSSSHWILSISKAKYISYSFQLFQAETCRLLDIWLLLNNTAIRKKNFIYQNL